MCSSSDLRPDSITTALLRWLWRSRQIPRPTLRILPNRAPQSARGAPTQTLKAHHSRHWSQGRDREPSIPLLFVVYDLRKLRLLATKHIEIVARRRRELLGPHGDHITRPWRRKSSPSPRRPTIGGIAGRARLRLSRRHLLIAPHHPVACIVRALRRLCRHPFRPSQLFLVARII